MTIHGVQGAREAVRRRRLKIYTYGYRNRNESCRRLARKAQRNVEFMGLT